ncbi:MAG: hypothetical protein GY870_09145 [archaeon]|nr:hypothetical protein [archaeon]
MTPKSRFIFILGRNPKLSILEIVSYLKSRKIKFEFIELIKNGLIIDVDMKFSPFDASKIIAGTIKICKIYLETEDKDLEKDLDKSNFYIEDSKKINYAFNFFGQDIKQEYFKSYFKKTFKSMRQKAFLKNLPPNALARAIKTKIFLDIVIVKSKINGKYSFGLTESVYNITENKKRYENRPFLDEEIGTSIRIARILVNLCQLEPGKTILDPFCGIGTVMQEALLLGFKASGTELKGERVKKCRKNLNWTTNKYSLNSEFNVIQGDARQLTKYFQPNTIDAIVSEPELGPLLKEAPTAKSAKNTINELRAIYGPMFKEASIIVKPKGKLVIILPRIKTDRNKSVSLDLGNLLKGTAFKEFNPINNNNNNKNNNINGKNLDFDIQLPIIYAEKWHRIERLLYILEKN